MIDIQKSLILAYQVKLNSPEGFYLCAEKVLIFKLILNISHIVSALFSNHSVLFNPYSLSFEGII